MFGNPKVRFGALFTFQDWYDAVRRGSVTTSKNLTAPYPLRSELLDSKALPLFSREFIFLVRDEQCGAVRSGYVS